MGLFVQRGDVKEVKDQIRKLQNKLREISPMYRLKPLFAAAGVLAVFALMVYLSDRV